MPYPHCYRPIIQRNTPLPLTRTERYATSYPYQTEVDIQVYQGDDEDALKNVLVGRLPGRGLAPTDEPNEILCRMHLDLDGILEVTAVEKRTGKSKHITIANALRAKSAEEIAAGQERIPAFMNRAAAFEEYDPEETAFEIGEGAMEEVVMEERVGGGNRLLPGGRDGGGGSGGKVPPPARQDARGRSRRSD